MKDLAIFGAGGLGREVELLIDQINQVQKLWNFIGYFDDARTGASAFERNVLGGVEELNEYARHLNVVVSVADPQTRLSIVSKIQNKNVQFPVIKHPNANFGSGNNKIGRGSIITDGCRLTVGIEISDFVIINLNSTIGHDTKIGSFSSIMPGAHISGNVVIGNQVLIGTGAVILQNLKLADHVKVGAGAVVTKDIEDVQTVVGIPARKKLNP